MASWQSRAFSLVLRLITKRGFDPYADVAQMRPKLDRLALRFAPKNSPARAIPVDINGLSGEWVEASGTPPARTILYLHGGGYIVCSPDTHRHLVASICRASGAKALVPDYRLAPENPFPAAVEDAVTAYRWLLERKEPSNVVIMGDSAGGGLTLALLLKIRDTGLPMPGCAALMSPWTDLACTGFSMLTHGRRDPMITLQGAKLGAHHYLQGALPTDPYASPFYGDYEGLPPLLIQVGGNEVLLDDSLRVAAKARQAGIDTTLKVWAGMPHVFQAFRFIPESRVAKQEIGDFIRSRIEHKGEGQGDGLPAAEPEVPWTATKQAPAV